MAAPKLIVGNWKMNGLLADSTDRTQKLAQGFKANPKSLMVLCPPATMIGAVAATLRGSQIRFGGQDCHHEKSGAFTGNISAEMLRNLGCNYVILGHSERRQQMGETDAMVAAKAKAAHENHMISIICVGETEAQRTNKEAELVVKNQLKFSMPSTSTPENTVIAYEPLWAIGSGKTASPDAIEQMHKVIRGLIGTTRILYGGSVTAANAEQILSIPNVDGVLVGGASLKPEEFLAIADGVK